MRLVKVDSSDLSKTISGAKFRIWAIDCSDGPQEFTTNASGEIDLSMFPEGSYEVTEIECAGYVIDDAQRIIELKPNEDAQFVFTNSKLPSLHLLKTSSDGSPLAGVSFRLANVPFRVSYSSKSGYLLDDVAQTAVVKAGRTVQLQFINHKTGNLIIHKLSGADKETPLAGVQLKSGVWTTPWWIP